MAGPWNANIHYDARLTACVPAAARAVLDVGCGDGFLAARLAPRVPHVVAIDVDAAVLGRARAIVGFTRAQWRDWPWAVAAFISLGVANRRHGKWEHAAPQVWPPGDSYRELRQAAREILPGARIRHLLMGRYLLTWVRPPTP